MALVKLDSDLQSSAFALVELVFAPLKSAVAWVKSACLRQSPATVKCFECSGAAFRLWRPQYPVDSDFESCCHSRPSLGSVLGTAVALADLVLGVILDCLKQVTISSFLSFCPHLVSCF